MRSSQRAVWRQAGCDSWDTLQVFLKFASRPDLCSTPPDRQAAGRWQQCAGDSVSGQRSGKLNFECKLTK